ncbi:MAG: SIMPL domain-containing protein [Xanthobacter sp.]
MRAFPVQVSSLRLPMLAVVAGVGLAIVGFAPQAAQAATVRVTGEAVVSATPDMATFSTGVVSRGKTAGEAMAANTEAVSAVIEAIKSAGIAARDVSTSNFSVQPQYVYPKAGSREEPRLVGFEVRNTVQVTVRDLSILGGLLDKMVQSGANEASGLSFSVSNRANLEQQAQVEAVKNAMEQAKAVAEAAGLRVTRIVSVEPSADAPMPVRPVAMMMRAEADRKAVPVEAGEIDVQARAVLVYEAEAR